VTVASQELYGEWSTAMIVIYPYSFMETRVLSIEKSITPFDGENKVTEKQYPVRGDMTKKNP
jgi:hypothetical protein